MCKHTPPPTRRIWHVCVCSGTYTHPLFAEASLTVGGPALAESREAEHAILSDRAAALRCAVRYVPARVAVNPMPDVMTIMLIPYHVVDIW